MKLTIYKKRQNRFYKEEGKKKEPVEVKVMPKPNRLIAPTVREERHIRSFETGDIFIWMFSF